MTMRPFIAALAFTALAQASAHADDTTASPDSQTAQRSSADSQDCQPVQAPNAERELDV